ncbi:hypothetical protein V3C99_010952 [Haemonchus contortus]|uniref:C2H2-type domain-containing protein n=1 Tax=Haemonchus contortus TaxID=6289 RepID=A0A7I4Y7S8_HAECO|nr:Zinc finger domain containing protein [Haemonchus contortus]
MGIECPECGVDKGTKVYSHLFYAHSYTKDAIERFKERKRQDKVLANCSDSKLFTCYLCGLPYSKRDSLTKHIVRKHSEAISNEIRRGLICPLCGEEVKIQRNLVEHWSLVHSARPDDYKIEKTFFNDRDSYEEWRSKTDGKNNPKLVIVSTKTFGSKKVQHYRCNRTLRKKNFTPRRPRTKKKVTCCTAFMEVIEWGDMFEVEYCKTHCGHGELLEVSNANENIEQFIPHSLETVSDILQSNKELLRVFDTAVSALRSKLLELSEKPDQQVNDHLSKVVDIVKNADVSTSAFYASNPKLEQSLVMPTEAMVAPKIEPGARAPKVEIQD